MSMVLGRNIFRLIFPILYLTYPTGRKALRMSASEAIRAFDDYEDKFSPMEWAIPAYNKGEINRAGQLIARGQAAKRRSRLRDVPCLQYRQQLAGIAWVPLIQIQNGLRHKGRAVDPNCIVAQRIKRLASITSKLKRFKTMTLSQMQDLGGCRAIVSSVARVDKLANAYVRSDIRHQLHTRDDYLRGPKPSGYRGVHLIYQYNSDRTKTYNGLKIEMQLRSQLQHAWATAVETVGTFVRQALKSSQGEQEWLNSLP